MGGNIRRARLEAELTQSELARRVGVESMAVSRWERGAVRPTDANLQTIAVALGRDFSWFFVERTEATA